MTFDELMGKIKNTVDQNNKLPFVKSITRNIILMGRTRTGKSTVARTLNNVCYIPQSNLSLYSETKEIEIHRVASPLMVNKEKFSFNIIDTPGFYDQTVKQGEKLSNEYITRLIRKCMKEDTTNIHCFAFVFNLHNGINNDDIKSMLYVKDNYPGIKKHLMLLLTHSEETTETQRKTLLESFFKHETVVKSNLKEFFGAGVFYMGCLRPQLRDNVDEKAARVQLKNILHMRSTLLNFLIKETEPYNIHHDPNEQASDRSKIPCYPS